MLVPKSFELFAASTSVNWIKEFLESNEMDLSLKILFLKKVDLFKTRLEHE
jgi:hypothetical protein